MADGPIALDTNVFLLALREDSRLPSCRQLLFDFAQQLDLYMPLQVFVELRRNLAGREWTGLFSALAGCKSVPWDSSPAQRPMIEKGAGRGAKKGDAVIVAHLGAAGTRRLVSENRHFLLAIAALPFQVIAAAEMLVHLRAATAQNE